MRRAQDRAFERDWHLTEARRQLDIVILEYDIWRHNFDFEWKCVDVWALQEPMRMSLEVEESMARCTLLEPLFEQLTVELSQEQAYQALCTELRDEGMTITTSVASLTIRMLRYQRRYKRERGVESVAVSKRTADGAFGETIFAGRRARNERLDDNNSNDERAARHRAIMAMARSASQPTPAATLGPGPCADAPLPTDDTSPATVEPPTSPSERNQPPEERETPLHDDTPSAPPVVCETNATVAERQRPARPKRRAPKESPVVDPTEATTTDAQAATERNISRKTVRNSETEDARPRKERRVEDPVVLTTEFAVNPMNQQHVRDRLAVLTKLDQDGAVSPDLKGKWITCAWRKSAGGKQVYWRGKVTKQSRYVEVTWSHVLKNGWVDIRDTDGAASFVKESLPSHDPKFLIYAISMCPEPPECRNDVQ